MKSRSGTSDLDEFGLAVSSGTAVVSDWKTMPRALVDEFFDKLAKSSWWSAAMKKRQDDRKRFTPLQNMPRPTHIVLSEKGRGFPGQEICFELKNKTRHRFVATKIIVYETRENIRRRRSVASAPTPATVSAFSSSQSLRSEGPIASAAHHRPNSTASPSR